MILSWIAFNWTSIFLSLAVSMLDWIEHIFQAVTLNDRNLVAMIMWLLWCRRNMLLERAGTVQSESRRPVTDLSSEYFKPSRAVKTYGLSTQLNLLFGVLQRVHVKRKRSMSMLLSYSVQMQLDLAWSSGWLRYLLFWVPRQSNPQFKATTSASMEAV